MYGIAIIRLLSFLFLDDFEGNTNISVAIKSSSTVYCKHRNFSGCQTIAVFLKSAVFLIIASGIFSNFFPACI